MAVALRSEPKKSEWKTVRFEQIAKNVSERVEPSETDLQIYVGLEHLDPESMRITRRGTPTDVEGQKLRVRPGQIIFGKRRAYQRKLAVADFNGICSAHAMVLEAVPGDILPDLLPYFMQSDIFMERAVAISEGSLSPTIKWKSLAAQEFALPSIDRQPEILALLRKVWETVEAAEAVVERLEHLKIQVARELLLQKMTFDQLFGNEPFALPAGWKKVQLGEVIARIQYGSSDAVNKTGRYKILRMMNIEHGYVVPNDLKYIDMDEEAAKKLLLKKGDILFNRTNSLDLVGRTGIFYEEDEFVFASYLLRINVVEEKVSPFYVNQYLNLPVVQYRLKAYATPGVSQANINPTSLRNLKFPLPPRDHCEKVDLTLRELDQSIAQGRQHLESVRKVASRVKNSVLSSSEDLNGI